MRIYIGGLGSNVNENDLKNTFTSPYLGTVESVEIIRSKGRSFGYLDFVPASDKGLAKLFSTYNGCMWKGRKLKLEKAKEDYMCRLRREWTEDEELAIKLSSQKSNADENTHSMQKPNKDQDIDKLQIKIFFPKLRKIKPLPLKGKGKHKYSFQRVEIPPLPVHFCDCEEHSGPPEPVKRISTDCDETETCGVNEEELNMMKSILNKLLKEEDYPMAASNHNEFTEEINHGVTSVDTIQVDDSEEDQVSDDDNLVINIVGRPNNRVASFENWGQKTIARNQDSLLKEPQSKTQKLLPDKKRKQPNDIDNTVPSKRKAPSTQPARTESGSVQLSGDVASSQKSTWKNLVGTKGATDFRISDILTDLNHEVEPRVCSDHLASPLIDSQDNPSSKDKELEEINHLSESDKELGKASHLEDNHDGRSSEDEELEKVDHFAEPEIDSQDDQSSEDEEVEEVDHFAEPEIDSQDDQSSEDEEVEEVDHLGDGQNDLGDGQNDQSSKDEELEEVDHLGDGHDDQLTEDEELEEVDHLGDGQDDQLTEDEELEEINHPRDGQDDQSSEDEELEKVDNLAEPEKDSHDNQSSKDKDSGKISDVQSSKPSASQDNTGRGASWLAKSSWLQLIGDANSNTFNLGQILPGVTFEKQELHQFDSSNLSNSKFGKQQKIAHKDKKSPTGDIKKPKAKGDKDAYVGLGNSNVEPSSKEQSDISQPNSETKQTHEENFRVANKRASLGDSVVSETCPFMRSAASMKEWAKTKAALSGSLKKKGGK